jgi:nucleoside-diphosphate-sugar epimerase
MSQQYPNLKFVRGQVYTPKVWDVVFGDGAKVDIVYSLAAQASANPQAANSLYTERTNLIGQRMLQDAMLRYSVPCLVYASSLRVYGNELPAFVSENLPYGSFADLSHLSKVYAEKLLEMYAQHRGLACAAVRLGVTYGVAPVMKTDHRFMTVPNKFTMQAVRGERLVVYSGPRTPIGLIHVADAAKAMISAGPMVTPGQYLAVNAANEALSVSKLAVIVKNTACAKGYPPVSLDDNSYGQEHPINIATSLFQSGYSFEHTIRDGIKELFDYWGKRCA